MDNDSGIIFGAGGRRSRDPSLLLSLARSRVGRHHHGRLAAASGGTSSSWATTTASSAGPGGDGLAILPWLVGPTLACAGRQHHDGRLAAASGGASWSWTTTTASSSVPGGGGLATPPCLSAPRLRASGVIITGVWLLRITALRRHGQRQRHHLHCRGAAVSQPLPASPPHACVRWAS